MPSLTYAILGTVALGGLYGAKLPKAANVSRQSFQSGNFAGIMVHFLEYED